MTIRAAMSEVPSHMQSYGATFHNEQLCWYAIHTRSQHERSVVDQLKRKGIDTYLPLVREVRKWSDRKKVLESPLFSCYVFAHLRPASESWRKVQQIQGALRVLGFGGKAAPIPSIEIENIQMLLSRGIPYSLCPFLKLGDRVRVRGGALDGLEGVLVRRDGDRSLIVSVELIQRSMSIHIEDYQVEAI